MSSINTEDIKKLLESALKETGVQLKTSAAELAAYTEQRAAHLATLIGDPDFQEAVKAERDAVWLKASNTLVGNADAAEARILGILQGALAITARILVPA